MLDLTISIINYKTKQLTANCIQSILNKKWKVSYKIIVIDNASGDGSVELFKKNFKGIEIIESNKNLGFAGGHNLALKKIQSRYVLILNSDTEVLDKVLDKIVDFMDHNPKCGISSCKVLDFDGKLQPNGGDLPFGLALFVWLFNLEFLGIESSTFHRQDKRYYETAHKVGWVSGNFMMIREEVLKKVGVLNDSYFMYFEDADYCYRVSKKGYDVMINPQVSIKHLSGGSLDHPKLRQWTGEFKGLIIFYTELFGTVPGLLVKLLIIISSLIRLIAYSLIGKFNISKTYAKIIFTI